MRIRISKLSVENVFEKEKKIKTPENSESRKISDNYAMIRRIDSSDGYLCKLSLFLSSISPSIVQTSFYLSVEKHPPKDDKRNRSNLSSFDGYTIRFCLIRFEKGQKFIRASCLLFCSIEWTRRKLSRWGRCCCQVVTLILKSPNNMLLDYYCTPFWLFSN